MDSLMVQHVMNWLVLGSIYSLIAIGFSLLFGLLNVIHFSHGDVSMIAPFVALASLQVVMAMAGMGGGMAILLAVLAAALVTGLAGIAADKLVIIPTKIIDKDNVDQFIAK